MEIQIRNEQKKTEPDLNGIQKKTEKILKDLGFPEAEISILLVDDTEIARLNGLYLSRMGPTNVISFPQNEGEDSDLNPEILGDVVISVETAQKEADTAGQTLDWALDRLIVHGVLHLVGYDHESPEADAEAHGGQGGGVDGVVGVGGVKAGFASLRPTASRRFLKDNNILMLSGLRP